MTGLSEYFVAAETAELEPPALRRWRALVDAGARLTLDLRRSLEDDYARFTVSDGNGVQDLLQ